MKLTSPSAPLSRNPGEVETVGNLDLPPHALPLREGTGFGKTGNLQIRVCMVGGYSPDYPRQQIIRVGLERVGVEVIELQMNRKARTQLLYRELLHRWPETRQCDVILVAAFNQRIAPLVWLLAKLSGKPVIVDYMVGLTDGTVEERRNVRGTTTFLYRQVDRFNVQRMISLTDTQCHREAYRRLLGSTVNQMKVLPVGVYDGWFSPQQAPEGDPLLVQFFGSYIPFHGIDVILQAAAFLRDDSRLQFELIGRGQTYPASVALARSLDLHNVRFSEVVPAPLLPSRVAQAAICLGVFGAREKTAYVVPNKVFQCMALGRPVITAESPALLECFTPGQHLVAVTPGNPQSLADAIRRLADSPQERARLGEAAAARIQETYLPQHIGARLKGIIEELIPQFTGH